MNQNSNLPIQTTSLNPVQNRESWEGFPENQTFPTNYNVQNPQQNHQNSTFDSPTTNYSKGRSFPYSPLNYRSESPFSTYQSPNGSYVGKSTSSFQSTNEDEVLDEQNSVSGDSDVWSRYAYDTEQSLTLPTNPRNFQDRPPYSPFRSLPSTNPSPYPKKQDMYFPGNTAFH